MGGSMGIYDLLINLPGPDRFLVIMGFLLLITLLIYRNMKNRARAEEQLREQLEDLEQTASAKECRIHETHHRIKNNLQLISSMIGLQAAECREPDASERLKQCQARVHSIAMIHELLNDSSNGEKLDVKPYLERLVYRSKQFLNDQASGVDVHTEIDRITVDAETATSCGLIVSELMTNCFKHAFTDSDRGRIDVRCERVNGHVELSVEDNGGGFESADVVPSESLGHEIVHSLVESDLDGDLDLQNTNNGANVEITFPAPDHAARRN
jgi:two-component sensor histidine kinase